MNNKYEDWIGCIKKTRYFNMREKYVNIRV